jgi:hypothetical protein
VLPCAIVTSCSTGEALAKSIVNLPLFALSCFVLKLSCPAGFAASFSVLACAAGDEGGIGVPVVAFGEVAGVEAVGVEDAGDEVAGVEAVGVEEPGVDSAAVDVPVEAPLSAPAFSVGPDVITAVDTAASTSTALIAPTARCPCRLLGKPGLRRPSAIETISAQATSTPPAT